MKSTAFVFPGQGSQSIGMLNDISSQSALVKELFSSVSDRVGYDLWELVQYGPEDKLNQTEHTQVAMLTADVAVYQVLQSQKSIPAAMMAGHSLGEYAALVCSGSLDLSDAAELVATRGRLMQETIPLGQGAMAAVIGLEDDMVQALCKQASTNEFQVTCANYNAIGQVVIAGHTEAVNKAVSLAEQAGAIMAKVIPVSVPCHCHLLDEAAVQYADALEKIEFKTPQVPVVSNVNLSIYESPEQIKSLLKEQLYKPVRWVETIQQMKSNRIEQVIECGPGKVLSGLVKRIDKSLTAMSIYDQTSLDKTLGAYNL
jgi:[acyl-carrier-protein] S-malonyltransferase